MSIEEKAIRTQNNNELPNQNIIVEWGTKLKEHYLLNHKGKKWEQRNK